MKKDILTIAILGFGFVFLFYFLIFSLLSKGCNDLSKSGDGSIMKGLGKEVREINDNFNKGFKKK